MSPSDPRHGTSAGARAHHRAGEKPCDSCRLAANDDRRARRPWTEGVELEDGEWRPDRRGILRWVPNAPRLGRPPLPLRLTEAQRRAAHAAHKRGLRDPATMRGEREYQRHSKARSRVARQAMGAAS